MQAAFEMLVVGAGLAGTTAALHAVESGKRVLLIEKSDVTPQGGNSMMSVGGFHAAFGSLLDEPTEIAARVRAETDGHAREELVVAFAENCARTLRWLQSKGVSLEAVPGGGASSSGLRVRSRSRTTGPRGSRCCSPDSRPTSSRPAGRCGAGRRP